MSALLSYLLDVKQYTCIYEFSLFPEPNLSFLDPQGKSNDNAYAAFCKVVYEKLKADGLWGRVLFSGPGDCANVARPAAQIMVHPFSVKFVEIRTHPGHQQGLGGTQPQGREGIESAPAHDILNAGLVGIQEPVGDDSSVGDIPR